MNVLTVSKLLNEKKVSPKELVRQSIKNITDKNPTYNAIITVCEKEALVAAEEAEREIIKGRVKGPFHGIPVVVKDMIYTKEVRTTMGSKIYADFVPKYDATVVKKLKEAGAIIIGKANTHEFAFEATGDISFYGPCRNPFNPEKISGGSSSGSGTAVATDMAFASLGTDTGGSIRIPSSACGIVGMKPTFGLVSKYGIFNLAFTLDHPGPMTKTVAENAEMLNILAGYDAKDPYSVQRPKEDYTRLLKVDIRGKVIGLPSFYYKNIDVEVAKQLEKVINCYVDLGAVIKEVDINGIGEIPEAQTITLLSEAYAQHLKHFNNKGGDYDPEVYNQLLHSKEIRAYEYVLAQQKRKRLIKSYNDIFNEVDVLLTPTLPILPTNIGQREVLVQGKKEQVRHALLRLTNPINYTGNPGLSVPCGFSASGLPIGFQLIGRHWHEALIYQLAFSYEQQNKLSY